MKDEEKALVRVRGCELATRQTGAGLPFVWGHGLLSNMAQEDAVGLLCWRDVGARLVRYDARGHGESAPSYDPAELRWPALARDMLALADTLGPGRVFLGGVSMGCATALHAAIASPARVAGLVLVAPPTAWSTRPRQARFYRVASSLVEWFGLAPFRLLAGIPVPGRASPVAAFQSVMVEQLARADARAVAATLRGAAESDLPEPAQLRNLRAPALILAWRNDPVHPVSTATRLAELLPKADLSVAGSIEEIRAWPERVARFLREKQAEARR